MQMDQFIGFLCMCNKKQKKYTNSPTRPLDDGEIWSENRPMGNQNTCILAEVSILRVYHMLIPHRNRSKQALIK